MRMPSAFNVWILSSLLGFSWGCQKPPQTWHHWDVPCSIRTLDVISEDHLLFAGSEGWVGETRDQGASWHLEQWESPDGLHPSFRASGWNGTEWFAVSIASPAWVARKRGEALLPQWVHHDTSKAVFLDAMAWWDSKEGLIFGDPMDGCLTLLKTSDAGESWSRISCDRLPVPASGEAGFAASNSNICLAGDTAWVFTGGLVSRCFFSPDRGKTWSAIDLPIRQGGAMTGVFSASFFNSTRGCAAGGNWDEPDNNFGNLIETRDGGQTWRLLSEGHGPGYRSSIIHHPNQPETLVAAGFQGVDFTLDGGRTWSSLSDSSYYVARFSPSGRTLWLAGKGQISSTTWPPNAKLE